MERKTATQVTRNVSVSLSYEDIEAALRKIARAPADAEVTLVFNDIGVVTGAEITYALQPRQHAPAAE